MMMLFLALALLFGVCHAFIEGGSNHECKIELVANWNSTPFSLQLIETFSGYNESLYVPLIEKFFSLDNEDEDSGSVDFSDKSLYEQLMGLVSEGEVKHLLDIYLANKFRTPRIESHFHHYKTNVIPQFGQKLVLQCGDTQSAWALLNDEIYCSSDDLFAIRADNREQQDLLLPFDRVIGDSDAPIIILYGSLDDKNFHDILRTLLEFSKSGQYRIVWRYIPSSDITGKEQLSGYGVDLTLKRTDYIAIDDRNIKKPQSEQDYLENSDNTDPLTAYSDDIEKVFDIESLELQFTKFILDKQSEGYNYLKLIIQDFPKYASFLSSYSSSDFSSILSSAKDNESLLPTGLYFNGRALGEHDLSVARILSILSQEFEFIKTLDDYGLTSGLAKQFIQDFASFKMNTTAMNSKVVRYATSNDESIIYLNDIEKDAQYKKFKKSRKSYTKSDIKPGQVPAIKENVHDTVFVIQFSDPAQVYHFLQLSTTVLYREIPQQIGIVPLIGNSIDLKIARYFLFLVHSQSIRSGFSFLQNLANAIIPTEDEHLMYDFSLLESLEIPEEYVIILDDLLRINDKFVKKFNIHRPQIILNGVFYDFVEKWQFLIARQLYQDVLLLREALISEKVEGKLRDYLFEGAAKHRNTLINSDYPDFEGTSVYAIKKTEEDLDAILVELQECSSTPVTLSLIGPFSSKKFLNLILEAIKVQATEKCLKLEIINTDTLLALSGLVRGSISGRSFEELSSLLAELIPSVVDDLETEADSTKIEQIRNSYGLADLNASDMMLFVNGRSIRVNDIPFDLDDMKFLVEFEKRSRLDYLYNYLKQNRIIPKDIELFSWFEQFSSTMSHHLLHPSGENESIFMPADSSRFCTQCINLGNSVSFNNYNSNAMIDVVAVISPVEELSQHVIAILELLEGFDSSYLNIQVLLKPSQSLKSMKINRFYRGVYPNSVKFDESGTLSRNQSAIFEKVPQKTLFTFDLNVAPSWVVGIKEGHTDLDNVRLTDTGDVLGIYELENILVEGYLRTSDGSDVGGIQIQLAQGEIYTDTNIMANLGYFQLKSNPGLWDFQLKPDALSSYELVSVSDTFSQDLSLTQLQKEHRVSIMDLSGAVIYPIFREQKQANSIMNSAKSIFNKYLTKPAEVEEQSEINIFSVASGHLYERFLGIMTESVMKHTNHSVKFWFIENYMSPTLRKNLPILAEKYGFSYELVTYKWPQWLRPQREKQRTIWGYKILFLDVLFPQNLEKVIFVDADQIVRVDMKELVDIDLEGAPYGYTPMCDSRTEMEGFRFWKQGYWDKVLGQRGLKYHISALYVIDLKKFRELRAGDILRQHYQTLSLDPGSLSNLDQDLPNNLQSHIKIFSLPQEWLWCETWCSDESLKSAKTIDLCNNPLTKEPKLDRARRQVAEWTEYDDEINRLLSGEPESPVVEAQQKHDEL